MNGTRKAVFPGTFDPFTLGHRAMVKRGLGLADEVIIAIGVNPDKKSCFTVDRRIKSIETLYANEPGVKVAAYDSLTADFVKAVGGDFILRGVRTIQDYEYEKPIADLNLKLAGIETVILFAEPEFLHISSTIVRELLQYKKDISDFVPKETLYILQR
ncbi:MAG: pantetheine-phosphate adenylyltransferase [Tannerella sp.]|jgi:pantetheine-phosphate adenylyltransferase|nr:pantetheine-phosphate adenylyltransferase [Tannerella sp.]